VTLPELRARKELAGMALLRIGRLSVSPVRPEEWQAVIELAEEAQSGERKTRG
jgi:predicted RNA-binding protein with PUA-like domain